MELENDVRNFALTWLDPLEEAWFVRRHFSGSIYSLFVEKAIKTEQKKVKSRSSSMVISSRSSSFEVSCLECSPTQNLLLPVSGPSCCIRDNSTGMVSRNLLVPRHRLEECFVVAVVFSDPLGFLGCHTFPSPFHHMPCWWCDYRPCV